MSVNEWGLKKKKRGTDVENEGPADGNEEDNVNEPAALLGKNLLYVVFH